MHLVPVPPDEPYYIYFPLWGIAAPGTPPHPLVIDDREGLKALTLFTDEDLAREYAKNSTIRGLAGYPVKNPAELRIALHGITKNGVTHAAIDHPPAGVKGVRIGRLIPIDYLLDIINRGPPPGADPADPVS